METKINNQSMSNASSNGILNLVRYLVGALFIFSGLVKANDPLGLSFKMGDFFRLWGMEGFVEYALIFAVLVIAFEIIAGIALIIGYKFKAFSFLLLLLMIFFTFLTAYAVGYEIKNGRELKCGCFGDCIPLTANQSFIKDIILLILVIYLFANRKKIVPMLQGKSGMIAMIIATAFSFIIQWFTINYLPIVDCLPFKKGNNVSKLYNDAKEMRDSLQVTYVFEEKGKKVKLSQDEFMKDENKKYWEMTPEVETEVIEKMPTWAPIMKEFSFADARGITYHEDIFLAQDAFFMFSIRDLETIDKSNMDKVKKIYDDLNIENKAGMVVVTSSPLAQTEKFLADHGMTNLQIFTIDEISNKILVRSNPGLVLIQGGEILGKWAPSNYPNSFLFEGNKIIIK